MHIVYVCSPRRRHHLFASLRSLYTSGTSFRQVTVYCPGKRPDSWKFSDRRIIVKEVPDISPGLWMINKTHLCRTDSDNILYLDTDTVVLKPLNLLYEDTSADIAARITTTAASTSWSKKTWEIFLQNFGAKVHYPYLNSGVILFRNRAHQLIGSSWPSIALKLHSMNSIPFDIEKVPGSAEQVSFSLACASSGLRFELLNPQQHTYAWNNEPYKDAIVFHTGSSSFYRQARIVDKATKAMTGDLPVPDPGLFWRQFLDPFIKAKNLFSKLTRW